MDVSLIAASDVFTGNSIAKLFATMLGMLALLGAVSAVLNLWLPRLEEKRSQRAKRRTIAKDALKRKLDAGISIDTQDVVDLGRGAKVSAADAISALYELYSETDDKERHGALRKLLDDFNREEPFEALPAEARPSLARINELAAVSSHTSDKQLLAPIVKLLEEYQTMKQDHGTIKRQSRRSYVMGIFGAILGVFGVALSFLGPSKSFVSSEIRAALRESQTAAQPSSNPTFTPSPGR